MLKTNSQYSKTIYSINHIALALITASALSLISNCESHAKPITWQGISPAQKQKSQAYPKWTAIDEEKNIDAQSSGIEWIEVTDNESEATAKNSENLTIAERFNLDTSAIPTYGSYREIYRGERWYPPITMEIPMGFGPKGWMFGIGLTGKDCSLGTKKCTPELTWETVNRAGTMALDSYIGFGDSYKSVGIGFQTLTQNTFRAYQVRGEFLRGNHTGIALSRNVGPDTAFKIGVRNLNRWGDKRSHLADRPKSAYAVISQRIRLKDEPPVELTWSSPTRWFSDIYITAGLANGGFRPIDNIINHQIHKSKLQGCWYQPNSCNEYDRYRAMLAGTEYGEYKPIGSVAFAINDQLNLITEWYGRNLQVAFAWQPFKEHGFNITAGYQSLIGNSDYGFNVSIPENGEFSWDSGGAKVYRPILSIRTMYNVKF